MDIASLYSDRSKFPDDMTIEVQGEKLTLKEWRDSLGLKSEFTKHTQKLSEEQKALQAQIAQRDQAVQVYQAQLAQAMAQRGVNPTHAQEDDLSAYRSDPAFGPLVKLIEQQQKTIGSLGQRLQMDELSMNSWRYQQQLDKLKAQDTDLNPQELAKFAHDFYSKGPDLEAAHKLYTYEKTLKQREAEAEQRGYEKAKKEPIIPAMPGSRRGGSGTKGAIELPKELGKRVEMAANDPQVMAELAEGLADWGQGR